MDNNLPPYQSKLERLNVECADPSMLQDCISGQKWKCINEDGRWRKHKCKFHREVQNHLAEVNKYLSAQSKRNCACFTPDGVVYTKIKSDRDIFQQKQKRFEQRHKLHGGRFKRETVENVDEVYIDQIPPEFLNLLRMDEVIENIKNSLFNETYQPQERSRRKRETDYMTQTIDELNTLLGTIEKKYENATNGPVQCFVEPSGKVNCSTIVYENEQAWKQSRVQIDMLIKVLKHKITNLKDIKRHLREHRPMNMTYDEENYDNNSSSVEDIEKSEEIEEATKSPKRKQTTHSHHHHPGTERKKKQKIAVTTEGRSSDDDYGSSATHEYIFEDSTTASSATSSSVPSQKLKNRTKLQKFKTTWSPTESSTPDDFNSNFSSTTESFDDFSMSETVDVSASTEFSTSAQDIFNSKTVTIDATIIEPKPRQRQNLNGNSVSLNVTGGYDQLNVPADCYCEPEFER